MYKPAMLPQNEAYTLGDIGADFKKIARRLSVRTPQKEHVLVWEYTLDGEQKRMFDLMVEAGEIIVHQMKDHDGQWCLIARMRKKPAVKHLYRGAAF